MPVEGSIVAGRWLAGDWRTPRLAVLRLARISAPLLPRSAFVRREVEVGSRSAEGLLVEQSFAQFQSQPCWLARKRMTSSERKRGNQQQTIRVGEGHRCDAEYKILDRS